MVWFGRLSVWLSVRVLSRSIWFAAFLPFGLVFGCGLVCSVVCLLSFRQPLRRLLLSLAVCSFAARAPRLYTHSMVRAGVQTLRCCVQRGMS